MKGIWIYAVHPGHVKISSYLVNAGKKPTRVYSLPGKYVSLLVSSYQGPELSALSKQEQLERLALYQHILEQTMAKTPLLAVKFGTLLQDRNEARRFLSLYEERLQLELQSLGDTVALEMVATWDFSTILAGLRDTLPLAEFAAKTGGQDSMEYRIQVGQYIHTLVERLRKKNTQQILNTVDGTFQRAQMNPLMSDDWVCNLGFLLEQSQLSEFYDRVEQLDQAFAGKLNFRVVGPLPPYNFATVLIQRPDYTNIESARRLLGLEYQISEQLAHAQYRRLTLLHHPDKAIEQEVPRINFAEITTAYATLAEYLQKQWNTGGDSDPARKYDISPEHVKAMLLLHVEHQEDRLITPAIVRELYEPDAIAS